MARIRTIKPEFFTSESIVALSPLARLLYVALWCEADREGRMAWKPRTFKMRYLPADACDIDALCAELVAGGLVALYGDGFAGIPKFAKHQHINPREAASGLPDPDASSTRDARVGHASVTAESRDSDAQGGKEGKGKEGERTRADARTAPADAVAAPDLGAKIEARGTKLPEGWEPSEDIKAWARQERPDLDMDRTLAAFRDYWRAQPGAKGRKADWPATFRNWVRNEKRLPGSTTGAALDRVPVTHDAIETQRRLVAESEAKARKAWEAKQAAGGAP